MTTDPRIEAAARALLKFETTTLSLDDVPGPTGRDMYRRATAAVAAIDKAATISTIEQIDALPPGSVVLDAEGTAWKRGAGSWVGTDDYGDLEPQPSGARVIHWGTE